MAEGIKSPKGAKYEKIEIEEDEKNNDNTTKESNHNYTPPKASIFVSLSAITLYGITSLAQTIFNKKVLATYLNEK